MRVWPATIWLRDCQTTIGATKPYFRMLRATWGIADSFFRGLRAHFASSPMGVQ
jgi:hypothetical protein